MHHKNRNALKKISKGKGEKKTSSQMYLGIKRYQMCVEQNTKVKALPAS